MNTGQKNFRKKNEITIDVICDKDTKFNQFHTKFYFVFLSRGFTWHLDDIYDIDTVFYIQFVVYK